MAVGVKVDAGPGVAGAADGTGVEVGITVREGVARGVGVTLLGMREEVAAGVRVADGCREPVLAGGVATGSETSGATWPSKMMFSRRIGV